jgi:hypothetical protein
LNHLLNVAKYVCVDNNVLHFSGDNSVEKKKRNGQAFEFDISFGVGDGGV